MKIQIRIITFCLCTLLGCGHLSSLVAQQRDLDRQLLDAVQQKDVQQINQLLSKGADVNTREPINGYFALQYAINWPDINLVKLLLDKGANVNLADQGGNTALTEAAGRHGPENAAIVKLLIARGADIHADYDAAILGAARSADPEVLKLLLSKGAPVDVRYKDNRNNTVLMQAAEGVSVEKLGLLLDAGADIKAINDDGQTALMIASRLDHRVAPAARLPMIELLLKKGSSINAKDKSGKTALLHSITQFMSEAGGVISHAEVVKLLLDRGADVQVVDERGDNALMITLDVWQGSAEIPRLLVEKGINLNAQNKRGTTSLMVAADEGKVEAARLLLERGADPNLKNSNGSTALDVAVENGRDEVAKLLFAKGVSSKANYKSEAELLKPVINSALLRASSTSDLNEVKRQLALGADINARTPRGQTPLMLAIFSSYGRTAVPALLIEQGADVNAVDAAGNTALMVAVEQNVDEVVQLLLDKKAKIYLLNMDGRTVLHIAALHTSQKMIRTLLAAKPEVAASSAGVDLRGLDVNQKDSSGRTPLMLAAGNDSFDPSEAMKLLVGKEADVDATDPAGNTALIMSVRNGHLSAVEFLVGRGAALNLKNERGVTALTWAKTVHTNKKIYNADEVEKRIVAVLVAAGAKE